LNIGSNSSPFRKHDKMGLLKFMSTKSELDDMRHMFVYDGDHVE